jgi:hypothetical protein
MRRAILHIGMPRTGTTSLQRVLTSLRPQLAQAGVLYPALDPRSASEPHLNHQCLGEALDGRRSASERTELLGQLDAHLAKTPAETAILSYEGLCLISCRRGVPQLLAALFARRGFVLEILATIKPQAEMLNSGYTWRAQFLREHRSFHRYVRAEIATRTGDYDQLLAPWRIACDGRLRVVPVREPRSDAPLLARVLAETGLAHLAPLFSTATLTTRENRSPGPVTIEVARRLHLGGAHLSLGSTRREATRFVEARALAKGFDGTAFKGLDPILRDHIDARWARRNDRFAQSIWGEPWDARVAAEPADPVNEIARGPSDPTLLAAVDDILAETCDAFRIRLRTGPGVAFRTMVSQAACRLRYQRDSRAE